MSAPPTRSYYSTFPAGAEQVIRRIVESDHPRVKVIRLFENAVLYRAEASDNVLRAPYFRSTFEVLDRIDSDQRATLEAVARRLERRLAQHQLLGLLEHDRHFRVLFSRDGRPASVPRAIRERMVRTIHRETGKPSRDRDADVEIWVALRREGSALLIFRRLRNRSSNSDRPKGMLAPEVGALLCRYSDPSAADVFLDPFCGHGGIFLERMRWKYRLAFALDRDQGLVNALKKRLDRVSGSWRKRTYVRSGDGRTLEGFEPGFITAIVTDPPWGEYDRSLGDVDELYSLFLASSANVLAPGGRIVLLAGRAVPVSEIVKPLSSSLAIEGRDDILVSGKKATLYKLSRR